MKIKTDSLVQLLTDIARRIEAGDSFEGSMRYTCMEPGLLRDEWEVEAVYRIGNSEGQGGVTILEPTIKVG
jgi:hypothetical protein